MKKTERTKRAVEALEKVGMIERLKHKPTELSGGQQQRVAIARALATKPAVVLADEPTGNLDSVTGEEVLQILQQLNREGKTIVMITHDQKIAAHANRIVEIFDGKISNDTKCFSENPKLRGSLRKSEAKRTIKAGKKV